MNLRDRRTKELLRQIVERRLDSHIQFPSIAINLVAELQSYGFNLEEAASAATATIAALFRKRLKKNLDDIISATKLPSGAGGYMEVWRVEPPPPTTPER